ncbi:MAG: YqaJ viral recombinase family protein [Alistipes sp.]|nr:YqaJ viral recombinase family protein [Alistipes sp.]
MSYTIHRPKSREAWLDLRKGGIGSSEVGTILGLNPYETPYQLWRKKKGLDAPTPENFAMRAGHYLEDAVSLFYQDETGNEIIKSSAGDWLIINNERPFLRVSPDRTCWKRGMARKHDNKGIVECKTTQKEIDGDSLPQHWFCQLQYQLGVAELNWGAIAWLTAGREFGYRDLTFDKDFYDWMIEEVTRFWVDCIQGNQEPLAINVEDVILKNPRHIAGKTLTANDDIIAELAELKEVREELAALDQRKKAIEESIKMTMGDAEALVLPNTDDVLCTWKAGKDRTKFDDKRFAQEHPDMYAQYTTTTAGTRTFLIK